VPLSDSQLTETSAIRPNEVTAGAEEYNDQQVHFSTALNAGWQKLEFYYNKSDVTPIHRAAVLLHPRMKWRWFERYWAFKPDWIEDARAAIRELWLQYKDLPLQADDAIATAADSTLLQDEWSTDYCEDMDQLQQYEQEAYPQYPQTFDSPMDYWIGKRKLWPQLARMALDIYSTPAMSDEPERVFSTAGHVLTPSRRCLTSDAMQWLLCLRSWQNSEIITLDQRLLRHAMIAADSLVADGDGDDKVPTPEIEDELAYHEHDDVDED
jgi:hypothetical protein